jgi:MFS transporter, DHA2 family, multidrug resistance protein
VRFQQTHINHLGEHVTPYDPKAMEMLRGMQHSLGGTKQGYAGLFGMVQQQAAMLSFLDVFRLLGIIFLALIPFVLLMRRPKGAPGSVAAH